ncbi:MAG: hypothetical protein H0T72_12065 [Chloroflexia bacterium]|nr:hypothetical protein [Chloroflexia bacterium]
MTADAIVPERPSLVIQRVGVDRMVGIDTPFGIARFSPGINVVHGPNAIGKSRTSKAIQALVWPELADASAVIRGELGVAGVTWHVESHYARVLYQRNGSPAPPPSFGISPANQHDRYLLTLHDLLAADDQQNRQFAAVIQRESAGGYDLHAARSSIGLAAAPKAGPGRIRNAYQDARSASASLKRIDQHLQARDRDRSNLTEALAAANAAVARVSLLEAALEHAGAVARRIEAEIARQAFDDPIGRMAGDEFARLQGFHRRIAELQQELEGFNAGIARNEQVLADAGFPEGLPSETDLYRLTSLVTMLRQAEADRDTVAANLAEAGARVLLLRRRITEAITSEQLRVLDLTGLRELGTLARRFREAEQRESAQAELAAWVGPLDAPANLDALRHGTELLANRLRLPGLDAASPQETWPRWAAVGSAMVIPLMSIVLAAVSHIAWAALGLLAIPLLWLAFRQDRSGAVEEARHTEEAYLALGLDAPAAWDPDHIEPLFDQIREQLAEATVQYQKAAMWDGLGHRRADAARLREEIAARQAAQIETLGITIGNDDPDEIRLIADAIDRWRQATDDLAAIDKRVAAIHDRHASLMTDINTSLAALGTAPATDRLAAESRLAEIQRRTVAARDAHTAIGHDRQTIADQVQPAIDRERASIDNLFTSLGLHERDDISLRERCGQVDACREAQAALASAQVVEQTRRHALAGAHELVTMPPAEIQAELDLSRAKADGRDAIVKEIARLDLEVQRARGQTALEEAVAHELATLEAFRDARGRDYARAAGWHVAEFVQRTARDQNRPAVFLAARNLFSQFTAGAWKLEMGGDNDPAFVAVETSTERHCKLADLSSGTRVQLLMAVRIAFIEASESGPQLPLILDETLGNADDTRANAIIDATVEIARRGRQIIYFTAQNDEIAKWQSRIAQFPGAPALEIIDLAAARGIASAGQPSNIVWGRTVFEPFHLPDGATHEDARQALSVPPVDLWAEHVGGVDLWYLIPDVHLLSQLRQAGITTWGQYTQLRRHDGLRMIAAFDEVNARIECRLQVIDTVRRHWQQGRPRPLTHGALLGTRLISDRFEEAVIELAKSHDWDGAALIRALRDRALGGFRQNVIVELEESFCGNGHIITGQEPLGDGMIRLAVLSSMREHITGGMIDEDEIDRLLQSLGTPGLVEFGANPDRVSTGGE